MRQRIFFIGVIFGLAMIGFPPSTWATTSPLDTIRNTVNQVTTVLRDETLQGDAHYQERLEKVRVIVMPQFDWEEVSKRALGSHWQTRTPEERREFTRLFTMLLEKSYSSTLDRYNRDVQFFFDEERIDNQFAEVMTRVLDPHQNQTFSINYRLQQNNGRWLVYDVIIENVSMVRNYRNQFNRLLTKGSQADLNRAIERKLEQLDTPSSSS